MSKIITFVIRGKQPESHHEAKCLIKDLQKNTIFSTNHNNDIIFPRSAIKIFQAIPFASSRAINKFNLNSKQIALACSSHSGEIFHIKELAKWVKKLDISILKLQCGIHNPLNLNSSNKLLLSGTKPNQLYNNCSGKHLGMLSGSIASNYNINDYLQFHHPYQQKIRKTLELYCQKKIHKKNFAIDGCGAPQYAFSLNDLSEALINLVKSYKKIFKNTSEVQLLMNSVFNNPSMIGGSLNFDSHLIKTCNKKLFCKYGAEGVFFFAHLTKKIVGVIKIKDGNERALPSVVCTLLKKLKITSIEENKKLLLWFKTPINNHAKKKTGRIFTQIQ